MYHHCSKDQGNFSLTLVKMTEILDDGSGTNEAMELECRLVEITLLEDE